MLTGIRFSHPGRSRGLVGALGESRKGFRGALGSPESSFGGHFRPSAVILGAVLDNLSEHVVPWKQFGASRRLYFCEKLFRERPKLISSVCVRTQEALLLKINPVGTKLQPTPLTSPPHARLGKKLQPAPLASPPHVSPAENI